MPSWNKCQVYFITGKDPEFPHKVTPISFLKDLMRTVTNTLRILLCSSKIHNTPKFSLRKQTLFLKIPGTVSIQ